MIGEDVGDYWGRGREGIIGGEGGYYRGECRRLLG